MCEQKKGKLVGYKNECAKKGDGPASQCGDKCNNKVRDGWMCVSAQEHLSCLAIVLLDHEMLVESCLDFQHSAATCALLGKEKSLRQL